MPLAVVERRAAVHPSKLRRAVVIVIRAGDGAVRPATVEWLGLLGGSAGMRLRLDPAELQAVL